MGDGRWESGEAGMWRRRGGGHVAGVSGSSPAGAPLDVTRITAKAIYVDCGGGLLQRQVASIFFALFDHQYL